MEMWYTDTMSIRLATLGIIFVGIAVTTAVYANTAPGALVPSAAHNTAPAMETVEMIPTVASWYDYSLPGVPGYSRTHATAASRDWPRGTCLEVCASSVCVMVRVNDYGPRSAIFPGRGIDLSSYAFKQLAPLSKGVIAVTVRPYTE